MSEFIEAQGQCVCGSVKFTSSKVNSNVGACHCSTCRNWGGGPLLAVDCGSEVLFEGRENIAIFDSSEWAERGFCSKCGSHLFYRLKHNNLHIMPVGLFGGDHTFNFDHQIFIEEKPSYYCFSNETKNMTGAEVFELAQSQEQP